MTFGVNDWLVLLLCSEAINDKYENKLQKRYDAPTYEVVSTVFRALTNRKVTVPGTYRRYVYVYLIKDDELKSFI